MLITSTSNFTFPGWKPFSSLLENTEALDPPDTQQGALLYFWITIAKSPGTTRVLLSAKEKHHNKASLLITLEINVYLPASLTYL